MREGALLFRLPFADAFELSEGSSRQAPAARAPDEL
jgi:hypothetical protein